MKVDYSLIPNNANKVAVAVSGGSDSIALLFHAVNNLKDKTILALNVEHGIRGEQSLNDTNFVKDFCKKLNIQVLEYSVDSLAKSKEEKLSIEQAARILRYECFFDALSTGNADVILTAHHEKDTAESVLFNLFRGTGLKGVAGINEYGCKILRPMAKTPKTDIENYINENNLEYCLDQTNFDDSYSRNYIRLNLLPLIEKAFPESVKSIARFSQTAREESEFLDSLADEKIVQKNSTYKLSINTHPVLFKRAVITILKKLGKPFDYEKVHLEDAFSLTTKQNGKQIDLGNGIVAIKEYDYVCFFKQQPTSCLQAELVAPITTFENATFTFCKNKNIDLKSGLYIDFDKLPSGTVIRHKQGNDLFTKFGGGTKKLVDYLTDKKIPKRERDSLVVLAHENIVYAIAGVAVSALAKVDENTKTIIKID